MGDIEIFMVDWLSSQIGGVVYGMFSHHFPNKNLVKVLKFCSICVGFLVSGHMTDGEFLKLNMQLKCLKSS